MNIQENSRIEYRSRINRVMDFIDQHLDQPLELKTIADVANFSPFHFHRIFTFLIIAWVIIVILSLIYNLYTINKANSDIENNNKEMDWSFIMMPKEGFGFSNYYHTGFTRPKFEAFKLNIATEVLCKSKIKIRYM